MTIDKEQLKAMAECAVGFTDMSLAPDVVLALLAEIERLERFEDWFVRLDQVEQSLAASYKAERDQLKSENEALRKQVSNLSPFNSFPKQTVIGSNRCLACGEYHHGLGNLPCPKMTPVAQANLAKEAEA